MNKMIGNDSRVSQWKCVISFVYYRNCISSPGGDSEGLE